MIGGGRRARVFAYAGPTDMRRGFEGLSAMVREGMGRDPLSGDLFLFVNKTRKRAKVLHWDGTGLCVYAKRLETRGRFACLWRGAEAAQLELTVTELQLFLEGSTLVGRMPLSPVILSDDELAPGGARRTILITDDRRRTDQRSPATPPDRRAAAARKRPAAPPPGAASR